MSTLIDTKIIPAGFFWNEADAPSHEKPHEGFVSIMALTPGGEPKMIGTAFLISCSGSKATALSAAHNFYEGVHREQNPNPRHHPSALPDFVADMDAISCDTSKLKALYQIGDQPFACNIDWVVWDKSSDVAVLGLSSQEGETDLFKAFIPIDGSWPAVGSMIAAMGYADMGVPEFNPDPDGNHSFAISRRLILRVGTVTALHDRHLLCRGPCVETTIPFYPGMSGGTLSAFNGLGSKMSSCGIISSDASMNDAERRDRSSCGHGIAALIPAAVVEHNSEQRTVLMQMFASGVSSRAGTTFSDDTAVIPLQDL